MIAPQILKDGNGWKIVRFILSRGLLFHIVSVVGQQEVTNVQKLVINTRFLLHWKRKCKQIEVEVQLLPLPVAYLTSLLVWTE